MQVTIGDAEIGYLYLFAGVGFLFKESVGWGQFLRTTLIVAGVAFLFVK